MLDFEHSGLDTEKKVNSATQDSIFVVAVVA